jgi:hypothetical protein
MTSKDIQFKEQPLIDLINWAARLVLAKHPDGGLAHEVHVDHKYLQEGREILKRLDIP